jgi:hypothetical protein
MTRFRLKISEQDFRQLQELVFSDLPKEAAAFALVGSATYPGGMDVLVRRPVPVPKHLFSFQHEYRLEVSSQAINGLISLCERNRLGAVLCHSHPGDIPYSPSDDHGERRIFEVLRRFIPTDAPTASLLFYPGGVRGRVWLPNKDAPVALSEVVVIGRHLRRIQLDGAGHGRFLESEGHDLFDREIRAFGQEGVARIQATKVGIVGVGGTGAPTAEQLVRLGARDLLLIDPDVIEPSNLTRVYGSFTHSLRRTWWRLGQSPGTKKVAVLQRHLKAIRPETRIRSIPDNVVLHDAATSLLDRDVIFLCTDDHWGRSIVNQIAYQYLIPTINLGTSIRAKDGKITDAVGVVDVLRPDLPCLWCRQFLRAERIAAESMPRKDRDARAREGYVEGLETAPSVVSVTTTISGMAVTQFLQLATDFMGAAGEVARLNYNIMDGTVRRGTSTILNGCICTKVRAFGSLKRLPTITRMPHADGS